MPAKKLKCRVLEKKQLTPSVFSLRFESNRRVSFDPGQFISVTVPVEGRSKPVRRVYSFANSSEKVKSEGIELCIKQVPGGKGTTYLHSLKPGDNFIAHAPYGDFKFKIKPNPTQNICLIATGSGIAPMKSFLESKLFQQNRPKRTTLLFGARTEDEIIYKNYFERMGVEVHYCISRPSPSWTGMRGRVTDYLSMLPNFWPWHTSDYYLCGNGEMLKEVGDILRGGHGVSSARIHQEAFAQTNYTAKRKRIEVVQEIPQGLPDGIKVPA